MTSAEFISREIHSAASYVEEVATAATAVPGSMAYFGVEVSGYQLQEVIRVTCQERGAVALLISLWWRLRQPGMVTGLRRWLLRGPLLREIRDIRARLDAVRVGHHPRWGHAPAGGDA